MSTPLGASSHLVRKWTGFESWLHLLWISWRTGRSEASTWVRQPMCHFSGFTRVINITQVILEAARIPYSHPLFFLVSPFCTCKFLLAALKMLILRGQSSSSTLPRLVVCLLGSIAPWEGWEPLEGHGSLLQAHSKLKHLMVGPTLWTVLRSEVSLGHLGEVVGGSGENAGFGDR